DDPFWQRMQAIWDAQKARGHIPRSVPEVETERQVVRDEWEERMTDMERLREQGRNTGTPGEPGAWSPPGSRTGSSTSAARTRSGGPGLQPGWLLCEPRATRSPLVT